ncbi:hypothetical protein FRC03_007436 [Tulasnella sp. 419]|nr:hypothetical protein FRC03_007436 [Tulasnella sp. 419]
MNRQKPERAPYRGADISLVIAIDFGTTFSGASWALLEPRQVPDIWDVLGYPGQEFQATSTKVPTVIYYDPQGAVKAAGAEIYDPELILEAEEERWTRVEWFKLLLRPLDRGDNLGAAPIPPLPRGKSIVDVVGDFLRYMSRSALDHFQQQMPGSRGLIEELKDKVIYVLSHPNGWDTFQHDRMRKAAILGGLVPDTSEGRSRINFVSEGEASLHWCVANGIANRALEEKNHIAVIDAGGGTIDVSSYEVTGVSPLQLKESKAPESRLAGSFFVTKNFERFVREKLGPASRYGDDHTIQQLVENFDRQVKCVFRRKDRRSTVRFGTYNDTESEFGIESGQLVVQGSDMADFFEEACAAAAESIKAQLPPESHTAIFLVGGFAANPWLFAEIKDRLKDQDVEVFKAETSTAKAAAHGAMCYYLDHRVSARVARHAYGVYINPAYRDSNPQHVQRKKAVYENPISGKSYVQGGFYAHVKKGVSVQETQVTRISLDKYVATKTRTEAQLDLIRYVGDDPDIHWVDEDPLNFEQVCVFSARIPANALIPESNVGTTNHGNACWRVTYDAVVSFGTTEFKCYIEWKDRQVKTPHICLANGSRAYLASDFAYREEFTAAMLCQSGTISHSSGTKRHTVKKRVMLR